MIGAMLGDIAGSRFEFHCLKSKDFDLFTPRCRFTDDTVMTLAVCDALLKSAPDFETLEAASIRSLREIGRLYPDCGYGRAFYHWLWADDPKPYGSWGNGAAMRISGCAWAARSENELKQLCRTVTSITHDHPEALKGAEATALAIYRALRGDSQEAIRREITAHYYPLQQTLDEIRPTYRFEVSSQGSVPQALQAFFEAESFEDAIRNAISLGGDSDTQAAIAGSIAEAYFGVPDPLREQALRFLDARLRGILESFETAWPLEKKRP